MTSKESECDRVTRRVISLFFGNFLIFKGFIASLDNFAFRNFLVLVSVNLRRA